jgi:hypothetical protein
MGGTEILGLLKATDVASLEIAVIEQITRVPKKTGTSVVYGLRYYSEEPYLSEERSFYTVDPENIGNGRPVDLKYNLDRFVNGRATARLPISEQLKVMHAALEMLAKIDPRIKGADETPKADIERLGGEPYDPEFMQDLYAFVQKEMKYRRLDVELSDTA